jgi:hypothetical protein
MTGRELFEALTRWFGLIVTTYGSYTLAYQALKMAFTDVPQRLSTTTGLIFGVLYLAVGLFILFGAKLISRILYGRANPN